MISGAARLAALASSAARGGGGSSTPWGGGARGGGEVPDSLRIAVKSIATLGNPWQEAREKRADWAQKLGVKPFAPGMELLYFPCCLVAYEADSRRIGEPTVKVLQAAGVDVDILGSAEYCCGESARK